VVLDAGNALAGITENLTFGSYAAAFNTEATNALAYSVVPMQLWLYNFIPENT
jgi:hypothetical protein